MPDHCPALRHAGRAPGRRGDALLPQRRLPRPGARGHRPLRLARRDGHPRAWLRAGPPAARHRADPRRGRPVRAHRRAARRARPLRRAVGRAAGRGHRATRRPGRCRRCSSASGSGTSARPSPQLLARRFGTHGRAHGGRRREAHQRGARASGRAIAEAVVAFFGERRNRALIERLDERASTSPSRARRRPTAR